MLDAHGRQPLAESRAIRWKPLSLSTVVILKPRRRNPRRTGDGCLSSEPLGLPAQAAFDEDLLDGPARNLPAPLREAKRWQPRVGCAAATTRSTSTTWVEVSLGAGAVRAA